MGEVAVTDWGKIMVRGLATSEWGGRTDRNYGT
jgi:hypothetical protein